MKIITIERRERELTPDEGMIYMKGQENPSTTLFYMTLVIGACLGALIITILSLFIDMCP